MGRLTEAGASDGSLVPGHISHRDGKRINLRYVDDNGKPVLGEEAYNHADADKMWNSFRMANKAGFTQIYAGDEQQWGAYSHRPAAPADPHESHYHLSRPNPRRPRH